MKDQITFADFQKLDIQIATVVSVEKIENKDKLYLLKVNLGDETRQLVAGIAEWYGSEDLEGKQVPILVNLEPKQIAGVESQGMILAVDVDDKAVLLVPEQDVPEGSMVH